MHSTPHGHSRCMSKAIAMPRSTRSLPRLRGFPSFLTVTQTEAPKSSSVSMAESIPSSYCRLGSQTVAEYACGAVPEVTRALLPVKCERATRDEEHALWAEPVHAVLQKKKKNKKKKTHSRLRNHGWSGNPKHTINFMWPKVHLKGSYREEFKLTCSELFVERSKKTPSLKSASLSTRRFAAYAYFSRSLDEVTLTITREIAPVHAKPTGFTAVHWSQGSTKTDRNTRPTTHTARFFSYIHIGKLN